jgi:hypothetical protein
MTPEMQLAQALGGAPDSSKEKLAGAFDEMSVEDLEGMLKTAFSVTEEGHKFDAERAKIRREKAEKMWALSQKHEGAGSSKKFGKFTKALRGFSPDVEDEPRHHAYVEKKHREGKNAWNPFGGLATPTKGEKGGSTMQYGEFKSKSKKASVSNTAALVADGVGRLMAKQANLLGAGLRMATRTPMATRAMVGAGAGAAGGAVRHMTSNDPNSSLLGNMAGGAALGAGAGAGAKVGAKALLQSGKLPAAQGAAALKGAKGYSQTGVGAYARKALGEANKAGTAVATKAGTTGKAVALKANAAAAPAVQKARAAQAATTAGSGI